MVRIELQLLRFEEGCRGSDCAIDDVLDGDAGHVPRELAGFDLCEVENVIDELGESFAFADDDVEVLDDLLFGLLQLCGRPRESLGTAAPRDGGE